MTHSLGLDLTIKVLSFEKRYTGLEWDEFDPACIGKDGFYPIPHYAAGRSLRYLYDLLDYIDSRLKRYPTDEHYLEDKAQVQSWISQLCGVDPPKESGQPYFEYLIGLRLDPKIQREIRRVK